MKEHHIVYAPGLNDQNPLNKRLTAVIPKFWKPYGFHGHSVSPHWEEGKSFGPKLETIVNKVDMLLDQGHKVSLIGFSAGGSAVLNAFAERRKEIHGVVNVAGRVREGIQVFPSLDDAAKYSPAFKESVLLFERKNEPTFSASDRKKIMTIRPWWDEAVPASTVDIHDAFNTTAPIIEHVLGGNFILTVYAKKLLYFLKDL